MSRTKNKNLSGFTLLEMFLALSLLLVLVSSIFIIFTSFTKRLNIQHELLSMQQRIIIILKLFGNDIREGKSLEALYEIKSTSRSLENGHAILALYRLTKGFKEEMVEGVSEFSINQDKTGIKLRFTVQSLSSYLKDQSVFFYFDSSS